MALRNTNLLLQIAPLPPTFRGTPQELIEEMTRRAKIVSPSGTNFIYVGDIEPTSNVGPWVKGGDRWYVFDEDLKRYVPVNIEDSEKTWFAIGNSTPETSDPPVWLRTTKDATEADPSYGQPLSWYVFDSTNWVPFTGIVLAGPTINRPSAPVSYQQYYDTTISVLLWYERGTWRTVSGVPGDVKAVAFDTLQEALDQNPGWEVLGASNSGVRGRYISQATKDDAGVDLSVSSGVAKRTAFETFGETDGVAIDSSSDVPYPPSIALWHLVKT